MLFFLIGFSFYVSTVAPACESIPRGLLTRSINSAIGATGNTSQIKIDPIPYWAYWEDTPQLASGVSSIKNQVPKFYDDTWFN